jgi:hypothetical protein
VVKAGIDSPAARKKIEDDERNTANLETSSNPMARDNARFVANQQQQTARLIEQQDASLDSLGVAVDRLGKIGKDINEEVKEQNVLLDALGNEVDDAHNRMDVVTASLSKLLQTKDGCQIWTIVILTFILILLSKYCYVYMHCPCLRCPNSNNLTRFPYVFLCSCPGHLELKG